MRPPFSTMKRRPTSPGGAVAKTGSANPAATRVAAIALVVACGPVRVEAVDQLGAGAALQDVCAVIAHDQGAGRHGHGLKNLAKRNRRHGRESRSRRKLGRLPERTPSGTRVPEARHRPGRSPAVQASACSRRSLPQNISPSSEKKVGAPKMPRERASSVSALSAGLVGVGLGALHDVVDVEAEMRRRSPGWRRARRWRGPRRTRPGTPPSRRSRPRAGRRRRGRRGRRAARSAGTDRAVRNGRPERRRLALHVAPHVAALAGIEVERRGGPALRREDRPEQERPPADVDARRLGERLDAHRGQDRNRSRRTRTRTREPAAASSGNLRAADESSLLRAEAARRRSACAAASRRIADESGAGMAWRLRARLRHRHVRL